MTEPATLQSVLTHFLDPSGLDTQRRKVCRHLQACRTPAMGGMRLRCDQCGREQQIYHGCRDRHCPQCQARATRQWAERQRESILPVRYHHLVFTLPHALNGWVQLHPEAIYQALFQSTWGTLRAFGQDPKRLGGALGMTAVLHTWGQNLSQHVHLHCLIPGGVLRADGQWQPSKGFYLFPVRALSRHYRGRMVSLLRQSATAGELHRVTRAGEVDTVLDALMQTEWVVYSKPCLDHTGTVVDYLARYSHRIALTNSRIQSIDQQYVHLRIKDYRDHNRIKTLCLGGTEFVRRFLLHVLPKGLMRIRHFGFLANRVRRAKLTQIRERLSAATAAQPVSAPANEAEPERPCPACREGRLQIIAQRLPAPLPLPPAGAPP